MIPRRIAGATNNLGRPKTLDDAECRSLWVRATRTEIGVLCESAWEPTPAELEALNAGGSVVLSVLGGQPPVKIRVEPPIADDEGEGEA